MNDEATQALSLMAIGSGQQNQGRMALTERFEKIQGARPGVLKPAKGGNGNGGRTLNLSGPRQNARSRRFNR
jgi:hypothetical protein